MYSFWMVLIIKPSKNFSPLLNLPVIYPINRKQIKKKRTVLWIGKVSGLPERCELFLIFSKTSKGIEAICKAID